MFLEGYKTYDILYSDMFYKSYHWEECKWVNDIATNGIVLCYNWKHVLYNDPTKLRFYVDWDKKMSDLICH